MSPYAIAQTYIGITEGSGPEDNPTIREIYASVGHDWVEHDTVAWCAAFVGHCLERAGMRSTRRLNAHSYLTWGVPVDLEDAQAGDVVVFACGNTHYWQSHVGFFVRTVGASIEVLGGNHGEEVSVRRYSRPRLLGVRREGHIAPAVTLGVQDVQSSLRALGYHEIGTPDGVMGSRTRSAVLAFRADNNLPLLPVIDVALTDILEAAQPRPTDPERVSGMPSDSRIVSAANIQIGLGTLGAVAILGSQLVPAFQEIAISQISTGRLRDFLVFTSVLPAALDFLGLVAFLGIIHYAVKARKARIEDHRTGKTP
ncbi:MAG: TIGR02594 family protein [Pelagibaca sp.]